MSSNIVSPRPSNERLRETIVERLRSDDQIEMDNIDVVVRDGDVTLTGVANGRWSKVRAEDIVWGVAGVRTIHNQVRTDHEPRIANGQVAPGGTDAPK